MTLKDGKPCKRCGASDWYSWGNCKQCARNRTKQWRIDNPGKRAKSDRKRYHRNQEKYLKQAKEWRARNKDKVKAKGEKWRKENPNYLREYYQKNKRKLYKNNRQWALSHPDKNRKYKREWKKRNPENEIVYKQKRRALKTKAGGSFTKQEWIDLCNHYNYKCLACGEKKKLTVDHIIPISKGGTSNIDNIQPLCRSCNSRKNNKVIDYR